MLKTETNLQKIILECLAYNPYPEVEELVGRLGPVESFRLALQWRPELRRFSFAVCRELARQRSKVVRRLLLKIIWTVQDACDFLQLYWDTNKRRALSNQVKRGLAYALSSISKDNSSGPVKLRDVLFLTHPNPTAWCDGDYIKRREVSRPDYQRGWVRRHKDAPAPLVVDGIRPPTVWSDLEHSTDHQKLWSEWLPRMSARDILANIVRINADERLLSNTLETVAADLTPLEIVKAWRHRPDLQRELDGLLYRSVKTKLPGDTVLVLDVSRDMTCPNKGSYLSWLEQAAAMAMLARESCEHLQIYCTGQHKTHLVMLGRGLDLYQEILRVARYIDGEAADLISAFRSLAKHVSCRRVIAIVAWERVGYAAELFCPNIYTMTMYPMKCIAYNKPRSVHLFGFTENLFRFIKEYERGLSVLHQEPEVHQVQRRVPAQG